MCLGLGKEAAAQSSAAPPPYPPQAALSATPAPYVQGTPSGAYPGIAYPATARPLVLPYSAGAPPPPGYHLEENPRKGLIVAGALTFGVPYLISLTIGGASRHEADRWLLLPVVGPVGALAYGMRGCDRDVDALQCTGNILIVVGLAFDLAAQTAGAILLTMGFVFPKKQWVNDYEVGRGATPAFTWTLAPRVDGAGRMGLTLSGTIF
jgi:hypothetical protein